MEHPRIATRRSLLTAGASLVVGALAAPGRVLAQAEKIKVGHLTPMTGFLGALGEYATMGIKMAVEEINAAGGANGRQIELISEDSVNPQVADGRDLVGFRAHHLTGGGAQQEAVPQHRRTL